LSKTWSAECISTLVFLQGKRSGASKMHRGVKGTTGMIPIAHSRYKSTRQHIFQASGLRVLGSSAACNKMLRHIHKPFRRIRVHLPSFAFFFPVCTTCHFSTYCRATVHSRAHTSETHRDPKPHALVAHPPTGRQQHHIGKIGHARVNAASTLGSQYVVRPHLRRAVSKTKDLDAQLSTPHHLPPPQTRPRTT